MPKPTSNVTPPSVTPSTEAPVAVPATVSIVARYNYGGTAPDNAVPLVLVPHGGRAPDGTLVNEDTVLWEETKLLPTARDSKKNGTKGVGSELFFPIQRVTIMGHSFVAYGVAGSRTREAAKKQLASFGLEAGGLAQMSDADFEAEAARIAQEEAEKVLARLRAKREALGLLRK
jgi:hypothetical protein